MGYAAAIGVTLVVLVLAIGLLQIRFLTREAR
jgi:ABC-type sugar transport system permease subunit